MAVNIALPCPALGTLRFRMPMVAYQLVLHLTTCWRVICNKSLLSTYHVSATVLLTRDTGEGRQISRANKSIEMRWPKMISTVRVAVLLRWDWRERLVHIQERQVVRDVAHTLCVGLEDSVRCGSWSHRAPGLVGGWVKRTVKNNVLCAMMELYKRESVAGVTSNRSLCSSTNLVQLVHEGKEKRKSRDQVGGGFVMCSSVQPHFTEWACAVLRALL